MPSELAERLYALAEKWVQARANVARAIERAENIDAPIEALEPLFSAWLSAEEAFEVAVNEALPAKPFRCVDCGSTGTQGRMSTGELIPICDMCKALADNEAATRLRPVVSLGQGTSRVDVMEGDLVRSKA